MFDQILNVYFLRDFVSARDLETHTVAVIDVLRATTTICQALASGAREVVPFQTIDDALEAKAANHQGDVVLGGERGGRRIDGFDLGNSPAEYTSAAVGGHRVYFTTTNGTQALYHARYAGRVIIASLVNLSAVVASLKERPQVEILCAGTNGHETQEDTLAAGAIVDGLYNLDDTYWQMNEAAEAARSEWHQLLSDAADADRTTIEQVTIELRDTLGGRNLIEVGLDRDLADCAQIDRLNIVPVFDVDKWRITVP